MTWAFGGVVLLSPDTLILRLAGADPWTLLFWRGVLTGLAYLLLLGLLPRPAPLAQVLRMSPPGWWAALLFTASSILFVVSISLTSVANTLVIMSAGPLFAAVFTALFTGQGVAPRTWLATLAAWLGLAVVFAGELRGDTLAGNLCALGAACSLAATFVLMRHTRHGPLPSLALASVLLTLVTAPLAAPAAIDSFGMSIMALLCLVLLPVSLLLMMGATRLIGAAEVNLVLLLEAVLGPLWVWLAIGEVPARNTVLGGGLLLLTLCTHSAWGLHLQRRERARTRDRQPTARRRAEPPQGGHAAAAGSGGQGASGVNGNQ